MSLHEVEEVVCLSDIRAENWQRRSRIIHYCVNVVDQQMEEKRRQIVESDNTAAQRKIQGALYADEVKVCNALP